MSYHEFEREHPQKSSLTKRGRAAVAGLALLATVGVSEKAHPSTEVDSSPFSWVAGPINQLGEAALHIGKPTAEEKIIKSPENIPEGHKIDITVDSSGDGPIKVSQQYGAENHIEDLANELKNEQHGKNLQPGTYTVYDEFVDDGMEDELPPAH